MIAQGVLRLLMTGAVAIMIAATQAAGQTAEQSRLIESMLQRDPSLARRASQPGAADSLLLGVRGNGQNRLDSARLESDSATDSIVQIEPRSAYQRLFRGEILNPDSLLDSLRVFGRDAFAQKTSAAAATQLAVPAQYPMGPGDEIVLLLWGRLNEQHRLSVGRDGTVNVPRIGPVTVGGMPFGAMQKTLIDRLKTIEGVEVSVTLGQLRSIQVYVMGEVVSPGFYTLSALANVTTALFASGGPTPMGSLRSVELRRGGRLVRKVDFYDFLLSGVEHSSLRLQPGDVVFVPIVKRMAAVAGNVRRSAIYEIEAKATLSDVLALAGGVSPGGAVNRIQIERIERNSYQTVHDITASSADSIPKVQIMDGDLVKVFPIVNRDENVVFLDGNVKRPGKYALAQDMRISTIISTYDILLPESYFIYAVVERFDPPSYLARIIPFNLQRVLDAPGSAADIELQSRDRIIIYHRDYFEPDRSITVDGSVTKPGKFKLLDNMRIRDLVLQAGGLREDASMVRGELYRRRLDADTVSTDKIEFNIIAAMSDDPAHNLMLQRFDRVFIRQKRGWQEEKSVILAGEFMYPGRYVVFEGESMEDLIVRAGGFTAEAYLAAAVMTRISVRDLERKRRDEYIRQLEQEIVQASAMVAAEQGTADLREMLNQQTRVLDQLRAAPVVGRVVIDITQPKNYRDFGLEHADVVFVPRNIQTVSVIGEVYNPATFRFETEKPQTRRYVQSSGGFKPTARKRDSYVIKASGSVVSRQMARVMRYELAPGDVVVVPQKVASGSRYRAFSNTLDTILKFTTIASSVSTTVLTLKLTAE
jgi:polysaccharide biosynthesis/export protein